MPPSSDKKKTLLEKFVTLFLEKNKSINLSSIRDEEGIWEKHITDSLIITDLLQGYLSEKVKGKRGNEGSSLEVLDLGTGGGFPGIPLAIIFPECHFTLLDARRKKIDCVAEFVKELALKNVTPQWGRAEEGSKKFDLIVTRATAYIDELLAWISPLLKSDGRAWLYKQASEEEWNDGQKIAQKLGFRLEKILIYELAGQERWIIEARR